MLNIKLQLQLTKAEKLRSWAIRHHLNTASKRVELFPLKAIFVFGMSGNNNTVHPAAYVKMKRIRLRKFWRENRAAHLASQSKASVMVTEVRSNFELFTTLALKPHLPRIFSLQKMNLFGKPLTAYSLPSKLEKH